MRENILFFISRFTLVLVEFENPWAAYAVSLYCELSMVAFLDRFVLVVFKDTSWDKSLSLAVRN